MRCRSFVFLFVCIGLQMHAVEATAVIPPQTQQLIVGLARDWDDSYVVLQRYELRNNRWQPVGPSVPGRLGRKGLAWGRGLHPPQPGRQKEEGDQRSPAGVFRLGGLYGSLPVEKLKLKPKMTYHRVTPDCLWVEDPHSPYYNQYLRAKTPGRLTTWEKQQQMKQNDPAHELKLLIHHNTPPNVVPGAGSAIFFHIWRKDGAQAPTGCTVISRQNLIEFSEWLDPDLHPVYVLLPQREYLRLMKIWNLPQPPLPLR